MLFTHCLRSLFTIMAGFYSEVTEAFGQFSDTTSKIQTQDPGVGALTNLARWYPVVCSYTWSMNF